MLGKKYVSVEIGSRIIKIASINFKKNHAELLGYALVDTPVDSIIDGKIINLNSLAKVIKDTIKSKKIKGKKLILSIAGNGVIARDMQIPKSNDDEIESILEFEAQQYFPVNLENYTVDYKTLEVIEAPDGIYNRIFVVAVPDTQVDEYLKLAEMLRMDLYSIDYPANGLYKLLNYVDLKNDEMKDDVVVLDFGANLTGMFIFSKNVLKLYRYLQFGGADIDKIIAQERNTNFSEAESFKMKKLNIMEEDEFLDNLTVNLNENCRQSINILFRDMERLFDFYNSRSPGHRVSSIYICGGGAGLKGLKDYIKSYFNIPVEFLKYEGNFSEKIKDCSKLSFIKDDFNLLINVLGVSIR